VISIIADIHERRSGVPRLLAETGVAVDVRLLEAGDYLLGGRGVVERKTVRGLHAAIISGRFWPQVRRLRTEARFPYVLVEGSDLDDGPLAPAAVRGACIALMDLGVAVIRTADVADSALWLQRLAQRRNETRVSNRPAYAQRPKRPEAAPAAEAALACVPGISGTYARALLRHFGTLQAVVDGDADAWQEVPGIGPRRAAAMEQTFRTPHGTSHSAKRNGRRAT
jgi:DNA excision repair protein ERCC-4